MREVVFTYGRFNPPTKGHEMMIKKMKNMGKDTLVIVSHTQNSKKNPLSFNEKKKVLQKMFPDTKFNHSSKGRQIKDIVRELQDEYDKLTMVIGKDRLMNFIKFLPEVDEFVSAGNRSNDENNVSGISATLARKAIKSGDDKKFKRMMSNVLNNKNLSELSRTISERLKVNNSKKR